MTCEEFEAELKRDGYACFTVAFAQMRKTPNMAMIGMQG